MGRDFRRTAARGPEIFSSVTREISENPRHYPIVGDFSNSGYFQEFLSFSSGSKTIYDFIKRHLLDSFTRIQAYAYMRTIQSSSLSKIVDMDFGL